VTDCFVCREKIEAADRARGTRESDDVGHRRTRLGADHLRHSETEVLQRLDEGGVALGIDGDRQVEIARGPRRCPGVTGDRSDDGVGDAEARAGCDRGFE